jgi:redox-sensitive bicupin YhaK (pirin superfamily)
MPSLVRNGRRHQPNFEASMIEHRPFDGLPADDHGWLKARHHFSLAPYDDQSPGGWGCMRGWSDEELAPNRGFPLEKHSNIEIITYVCEGTVTHRDGFGGEGRIEAGSIQVLSAGTGIRHGEYNLEHTPARFFRIWIAPTSPGGGPAWGIQPCPPGASGCFVAIASGFEGDREALPIRACARVLKAKLKVGETTDYTLHELRLAYLVPSSGVVDVNGKRIRARDGAAIRNADLVTITAVEDADVVMVDVH